MHKKAINTYQFPIHTSLTSIPPILPITSHQLPFLPSTPIPPIPPINSHHKQKKPPGLMTGGLLLSEKTAATYSPTGVQYHRRGRA